MKKHRFKTMTRKQDFATGKQEKSDEKKKKQNKKEN